MGSPLTDEQWAQASLPVEMGGLGLRSAVDHAPTAHAVSLLAAQPLLDGLLGEDEEESGSKQREETFVARNHCRPGNVTIRRWINGKEGVIDVAVTGPLSPSTVAGAAAEAPRRRVLLY